jgi:tetratricopeptide (TPR) repeat protein
MYNLLIALAAGIAIAAAVMLFGFPIWAGIIPGVVALLGTFVLLARRVATRVQALVGAAQKELSSPPANQREQKAKIDKAVKILEEGLAYDRWQFMVGPEIHAQIAMIKYMVKDHDGALAHFQKGSPRNYMAKAMEGALYYQRKDYSKMEACFEAAVKSGKKEALVWAVYAWCQQQLKEKDKALRIMARAVEANPTEEKLKAGLNALQNDKKLKMKPYEPMWWQFGLENPPLQAMGGRQVRFERR